MPLKWNNPTQGGRKEAVSASDAPESTQQKQPRQVHAILRWLQEQPRQEPWNNIQRMNKTDVLKASMGSLASPKASESGKSPGQTPKKGPQAERKRSLDTGAPPEDEYKLSIQPLIFQLYQLCSAGDLRTRKPRERGDSENPQDGGSTQPNTQRQIPSSEKRKRSGSKLPSNEDTEQNNHDDEDDEHEEPPAKRGGHTSAQELASHFGCWFYKRAPGRYPLCAAEHGRDVFQLRRHCFEKHERRGDRERENIDLDTYRAARGVRCASAITGPLRAEETWKLTYMKLWNHNDRHTIPSPYFLGLGITSAGWADRAATVANHLQPHASPELRDRLVSLVSQARAFEAQARSISQDLQDLLHQFELGLPPRLRSTLHYPPTFSSGHVVANDACHGPTSAGTPAISSTWPMNHNRRHISEEAFSSYPSSDPIRANAGPPSTSRAIVLDTNGHQLSNQAVDSQSRFLSLSWSQNHLGDSSIPTNNSVPLQQAPATVAPPTPETNGGYRLVVPAALSASNEDANSSSVAPTSLVAQDASVAYESVAGGSPMNTNTENSGLSCSCNNCWLDEYAKL